MSTQIERQLKAIERLMQVTPDDLGLHRYAAKLRNKLTAIPMSQVLAKWPGSVAEKAKHLGVSRQTVYYWLDGSMRPDERRAEMLARLTGFSVAEIRGRDDPA